MNWDSARDAETVGHCVLRVTNTGSCAKVGVHWGPMPAQYSPMQKVEHRGHTCHVDETVGS